MDSIAAHKFNFNTEDHDITVIFLHPNTATVIQRIDQGVIAAFKKNYRKKMMRSCSVCQLKSIVAFLHVQSNLI